jgi:pimeloyl-ACP methyl ester carboxylesterase
VRLWYTDSGGNGVPVVLLHANTGNADSWQYNIFEKLASIRVPTLLMPGDQDQQTPPWVMRRQLAHIPGAHFIALPEAAHSINWEQPKAFNRNVLEFIRRH